ncbi:MAG: hypothetical protein U5P41_08580 [Gammaproteobacteria bacterium]|nr:hypothetical protein [Gammaproteobacteria bacterium]
MDTQRGPDQVWRRLLLYLVPVILGLTFTFILFQLAWHTELGNQRREYVLESMSFSETVNQRLIAAEEALLSMAALIQTNTALSQQQFSWFIDELMQRHNFITAGFVSEPASHETLATGRFGISHQHGGRGDTDVAINNLFTDPLYPLHSGSPWNMIASCRRRPYQTRHRTLSGCFCYCRRTATVSRAWPPCKSIRQSWPKIGAWWIRQRPGFM